MITRTNHGNAIEVGATPPPKPVRFHIIEKLDELKSGQWWLYRVTADMSDGSEREGTVQGAHEYANEFAAETWEEDV